MDNVIMVVGIICFAMACACYEAKNDNFYRDLENRKLNVEIKKLETLKGIVDMCEALEIHLKIVKENQKLILEEMQKNKPKYVKSSGTIDMDEKELNRLKKVFTRGTNEKQQVHN